MNNENRYRLPAEWESQDAIALAWPHADTDWAYMLDDVKACFLEIARAINGFGEHLIIVTPEPDAVAREIAELDCSRITIIECPTNDTWARDTFAITTYGADGRATVNDFKFNGWGLKFAADRDNLITRHLTIHTDLFVDADYRNRLNFVLEGGSIESDGEGTLLTTSPIAISIRSLVFAPVIRFYTSVPTMPTMLIMKNLKAWSANSKRLSMPTASDSASCVCRCPERFSTKTVCAFPLPMPTS